MKLPELGNNIDKSAEFNIVAFIVNTLLLLTHITIFISFVFTHVKPMAIFNVVSVLTYISCYILIRKNHVQAYIFIVLTEIMLHLIAATICVGWNTGFHLYCFGMPCVIYYTSYIYIDKKFMKHIDSIIACLSALVFFILYIYSCFSKPIYTLNERISSIYFFSNSVLIFFLIITSLRNYTRIVIISERNLHNLADYDELTNVFTRRRAHEELNTMFKNFTLGKGNFCITMMDVDNFKYINDTFGHEAGDYVLKNISSIMKSKLKSAKRENSFVSRWGGDEFLIVQYFDTKKITENDCKQLIQHIHETVSNTPFRYNGQIRLPVSMTGGFSVHAEGATIDETFKIADEKLYQGKEKGKNCVVF